MKAKFHVECRQTVFDLLDHIEVLQRALMMAAKYWTEDFQIEPAEATAEHWIKGAQK
jgi:hypothetical protein